MSACQTAAFSRAQSEAWDVKLKQNYLCYRSHVISGALIWFKWLRNPRNTLIYLKSLKYLKKIYPQIASSMAYIHLNIIKISHRLSLPTEKEPCHSPELKSLALPPCLNQRACSSLDVEGGSLAGQSESKQEWPHSWPGRLSPWQWQLSPERWRLVKSEGASIAKWFCKIVWSFGKPFTTVSTFFIFIKIVSPSECVCACNSVWVCVCVCVCECVCVHSCVQRLQVY